MEKKVERLKILLDERELQLAIEDRYTNLRIWYSTHHLTNKQIFFRLDKLNNYSAPLDEEHILYLDNEHEAVRTLLNEYKFGQKVTIADLNRIIEITIKMKKRDVRFW